MAVNNVVLAGIVTALHFAAQSQGTQASPIAANLERLGYQITYLRESGPKGITCRISRDGHRATFSTISMPRPFFEGGHELFAPPTFFAVVTKDYHFFRYVNRAEIAELKTLRGWDCDLEPGLDCRVVLSIMLPEDRATWDPALRRYWKQMDDVEADASRFGRWSTQKPLIPASVGDSSTLAFPTRDELLDLMQIWDWKPITDEPRARGYYRVPGSLGVMLDLDQDQHVIEVRPEFDMTREIPPAEFNFQRGVATFDVSKPFVLGDLRRFVNRFAKWVEHRDFVSRTMSAGAANPSLLLPFIRWVGK